MSEEQKKDRQHEFEIAALIQEYLQYRDYKNTLECFDAESIQKTYERNDEAHTTEEKKQSIVKLMLSAYDFGDHDALFLGWEKYIPAMIRRSDPTALKLEFYLNIFMAIYPLHPSRRSDGASIQVCMTMFKNYLESKGSDLSRNSEFMAYFALPYVHNPQEHPSFGHLFSRDWSTDLRVRMERFLEITLKSQPKPRLYHVVDSAGGSLAQPPPNITSGLAEAELQEKLSIAAKREHQLHQVYAQRVEKLQAFCKDVFQVAVELFQSLERSRSGKAVVTEEYMRVMRGRIIKYHEVFTGRNKAAGPGQGEPGGAGGAPHDSQPPPAGMSASLAALDYSRLLEDLSGPDLDPKQKCKVLQALRWRLTKTTPRAARKKVLTAYIENDLLQAKPDADRPGLLAALIKHEDQSLREYTARLVNAMASECVGRAYLVQHEEILPTMVDMLRSEDGDNFARQAALGALQKLSLRRKPQSTMIDLDCVRFLGTMLLDSENLSEYSLEYGTALLMNLSLRSAGKIKCEDPDARILEVLNELLENENMQVRTYVNGTLYSVLTRPSLKERAKAMGMEDILSTLIKQCDETFARQLQYILDQLSSDNKDGEESEEEEGDDDGDVEEDEGAEEEEDDDMEETIDSGTGPSGEELLSVNYLASTEQAVQEGVATRAAMDRQAAMAEHARAQQKSSRPTTPGMPIQRPATPGRRQSLDPDDPNPMQPRPRLAHTPREQDGRPPVAPVPSQNAVGGGTPSVLDTTGDSWDGSIRPTGQKQPKTKEEWEEFQSAFGSRNRIPRTPASGATR